MEPVKVTRQCNRHFDCNKAEEENKARWLAKNPGLERMYPGPSASFHWHDDECEECFGN